MVKNYNVFTDKFVLSVIDLDKIGDGGGPAVGDRLLGSALQGYHMGGNQNVSGKESYSGRCGKDSV